MEHFFTVVIPVFNRNEELVRAVESVTRQTFRNYEIVVVDDGSSPPISEVVGDAFDDFKVRIIRQANAGPSAARNHGVAAARGEFVAFLDSDDQFLPHHLQDAAEALSGTQGIAYFAPVVASRGKTQSLQRPPRAPAPDEHIASYLMCDRGFIPTSALVVPRSLATTVKYRTDATFGEDTDFSVRLFASGCRFRMATKPGAIVFDEHGSVRLSRSRPTEKNFQWLEDLRSSIPPQAYYGYRGWHMAKLKWRQNPALAMSMYLNALLHRAYGPKLAALLLLQIALPSSLYATLSNVYLSWLPDLLKRHDRTAAP